MSESLSLLGFYFTLVGFISGLFFTRLDSWYGEVRAKTATVPFTKNRENFSRLKGEFTGLKSSKPTGSYVAVGLFLTALMVLGLFVPVTNSTINSGLFLVAPWWINPSELTGLEAGRCYGAVLRVSTPQCQQLMLE
jgi:hypothetical protein